VCVTVDPGRDGDTVAIRSSAPVCDLASTFPVPRLPMFLRHRFKMGLTSSGTKVKPKTIVTTVTIFSVLPVIISPPN
jgi:hypothetical protein